MELVKAGAPVADIRAVQQALEESEQTTLRRDHTWALEHAMDESTPADEQSDTPAESLNHDAALSSVLMLRSMLARITAAPRPRLMSECCEMSLGFKIGDDRVSMRDIAKRNGVTVEAVSKNVEAIRQQFELPAVEQNKSDAAIQSYKLHNGGRPKL